jgi:hypothetical protein
MPTSLEVTIEFIHQKLKMNPDKVMDHIINTSTALYNIKPAADVEALDTKAHHMKRRNGAATAEIAAIGPRIAPPITTKKRRIRRSNITNASVIAMIMLLIFTVEERDIPRISVTGRKRGRLHRPRHSRQRTIGAMMTVI